jgi:hypothetical protein
MLWHKVIVLVIPHVLAIVAAIVIAIYWAFRVYDYFMGEHDDDN